MVEGFQFWLPKLCFVAVIQQLTWFTRTDEAFFENCADVSASSAIVKARIVSVNKPRNRALESWAYECHQQQLGNGTRSCNAWMRQARYRQEAIANIYKKAWKLQAAWADKMKMRPKSLLAGKTAGS